ncbi:somatostatin receptor type 2-like [Ptychodera flava]|uniref:somatostatin receptor type 2-like n=1 Tax=Ptychodera flava TaxID=63121 RepID=UPI00396A8182
MNNSTVSPPLENYIYIYEWNDTYGGNDSSEGDGHYESRQGYNVVAYSLVLAVILILGLVGNCTFMYVTWKVPSMRTVLNIYLMNLCVADTLFLVTGIPIRICLNHEVIASNNVNAIVFFFATFCFIPQAAGLFTVTLISIERYVGICHPLKARYFRNKYRIWVSVMASWLVGLLPCLLFAIGKELMFKSTAVITAAFLCDILSFVVCLFIVFFLYSMIICKMRTDGPALANNAMLQDRKQVVVLLVVTTSVFFVCLFPTYVIQFELLLHEMGVTFIWTFRPGIFYMLASVLLYFNSAINPVIYNITSAKYREAFKKALDQWKCEREIFSAHGHGMITPPRSPTTRRQLRTKGMERRQSLAPSLPEIQPV